MDSSSSLQDTFKLNKNEVELSWVRKKKKNVLTQSLIPPKLNGLIWFNDEALLEHNLLYFSSLLAFEWAPDQIKLWKIWAHKRNWKGNFEPFLKYG